MFQSCNFGTEYPEVATALGRDIFEFFDLFFSGERNNYEKVLLLDEIESLNNDPSYQMRL